MGLNLPLVANMLSISTKGTLKWFYKNNALPVHALPTLIHYREIFLIGK